MENFYSTVNSSFPSLIFLSGKFFPHVRFFQFKNRRALKFEEVQLFPLRFRAPLHKAKIIFAFFSNVKFLVLVFNFLCQISFRAPRRFGAFLELLRAFYKARRRLVNRSAERFKFQRFQTPIFFHFTPSQKGSNFNISRPSSPSFPIFYK